MRTWAHVKAGGQRTPEAPGFVAAVQAFDAFTPDNDPYGEHDFGAFTLDGEKLFWKIDTYADGSLTHGAEDPTDPAAMRVLTIMLAEEY